MSSSRVRSSSAGVSRFSKAADRSCRASNYSMPARNRKPVSLPTIHQRALSLSATCPRRTSFDLFRSSLRDVQVYTFDELFDGVAQVLELTEST